MPPFHIYTVVSVDPFDPLIIQDTIIGILVATVAYVGRDNACVLAVMFKI